MVEIPKEMYDRTTDLKTRKTYWFERVGVIDITDEQRAILTKQGEDYMKFITETKRKIEEHHREIGRLEVEIAFGDKRPPTLDGVSKEFYVHRGKCGLKVAVRVSADSACCLYCNEEYPIG